MKTTRTFKSGNSVAVRLPKSLGVEPGTEVRVREGQGAYIVEPVTPKPRKIDVSGFLGKCPDMKPVAREDFEEEQRDWHLLRHQDGGT